MGKPGLHGQHVCPCFPLYQFSTELPVEQPKRLKAQLTARLGFGVGA